MTLEIASRHSRSSDTHTGLVSTLRFYLNRSVNSPLRIDMNVEDKHGSIPPVLNLLLDHTCRWRSFSYTGVDALAGYEGFPQHIFFPILEDLSLKHRYSGIRSAELDCFKRAPKLLAVKADSLRNDCDLPWNHWQLTSLNIEPFRPRYIHRCHNITTLILRASYALPETMSLARLKSFTFALHSDSSIVREGLRHILTAYTFPSLSELIIAPQSNFPWPPAHAFRTFISRSSCILTTLSISGAEISDFQLLAALRVLPYLVNFAFSDVKYPRRIAKKSCPITPHFISCMHASSTAFEILLPKLRTLSLTLLGTSFDDAAVISMASSRWLPDPVCAAATGIDCLRSSVLCFREREVDEEMYRPLYDLDRMGMQVVVAGNSMVVNKNKA